MGEKNDTSLIRLVVARLVEIHKWTYTQTLDKFYNSRTCKLLSNEDTGVFTYAPYDVVNMFEEENSY